MNTRLRKSKKSKFEFSTQLRIELSTAKYWNEKELLALCCGVPPREYGERDDVAPKEYREAAKDKIHEALNSGTLRAGKNFKTSPAEKLYGSIWQITPSDAVRWALPLFPNFPEWLASSKLKEIFEMQAAERKAAGRYTLKEAATNIAISGEVIEEVIINKLQIAAGIGNLSMYMPGSKAKNEVSNYSHEQRPINIHHEECYWDDLNSWLDKHEKRISFRFPAPSEVSIKSKKAPWDDLKLKRLFDASKEPGMTQKKLAEIEKISRSRVGQLLKRADGKWGTKKTSAISRFARNSFK